MQLKHQLVFLVTASVLIFASCSQKKTAAEGGYEFELHTASNAGVQTSGNTGAQGGRVVEGKGVKPKLGDVCQLHVVMRAGNKVINSTYTSGRTLAVTVENVDKVNSLMVSPFQAAVKNMVVGDSMTLYYPIKDKANKPAEYGDATSISYDIVMVSVATKEEASKRIKVDAPSMPAQQAVKK